MPQGAQTSILVIGEPLIELSALDVQAGQARLGFAGDTLNTAIYLARAFQGQAARVDYLTVLGQDALSEAMIGRMQDEGVGTGLVRRHPERLPGIYAIELDAAGERSFRYWRENSAARTLFEGAHALELLGRADVVYLSGITLAILAPAAREGLIAACHRIKRAGRTVAFDSNFRPALWPDRSAARPLFEAMWRSTSIGLPSMEDEGFLWPAEAPGQTLARIAALGVAEIVLKRGAQGPLVFADGRQEEIDVAPAARVLDSTGAGDAFNAAYLHARLSGKNALAAARAGHALAARVIAHPGAIMPRAG